MAASIYSLRPATLEDIPAILTLDRATELLPHWSAHDYAIAIENCLEANPAPPHRRHLSIAAAQDILLGFSVASVSFFGDEVSTELESIAVAASARRAGIGLALCREAIRWAQSLGATAMLLEVRSRSQPAIALYERLEFIACGRRPAYYANPADDAILMQLDLA